MAIRQKYRDLSKIFDQTMHTRMWNGYHDRQRYIKRGLLETDATYVHYKEYPKEHWVVSNWVRDTFEWEDHVELDVLGDYFFDNPADAMRFKLVWG